MNLLSNFKLPLPLCQHLSGQENVVPVVVHGNDMLPVFRHGDCLLVDLAGSLKIGDRVVAKDVNGAILGGTLLSHNETRVDIAPYSASKRGLILKSGEYSFLGRVIWASQ